VPAYIHVICTHTHIYISCILGARARTHSRVRDYELRGVRAYGGSSNEKPHYFLMHLLIDQSRKGNMPPTLRPPLPSVNHSRNNLMIGAPVLLSRLPRYSLSTVRVGDYYDAALREIFFLFSRSASPFMLPRYDTPGRRKRRRVSASDTHRRRESSIFASTREYSLISRSSEYVYSWIRETICAHTIAREARLRSHGRTNEKRIVLLTRASFHSNAGSPRAPRRVGTGPANIFAGIHEVNPKQPRVLALSFPFILKIKGE